eukprot:CAMPEP_0174243368 /NCGR_PEP_ID=MMETSP0417-20130205/31414_1 /TAXON_ID=242541 /ORGANISM="Mayorella sp, Strain BSH-02190019" /LENGTH=809 /DNA_ID=CAMNT_0015322881 /DNA_START=39 /DNA_END=2468 /DNA_ORIENTATION=+
MGRKDKEKEKEEKKDKKGTIRGSKKKGKTVGPTPEELAQQEAERIRAEAEEKKRREEVEARRREEEKKRQEEEKQRQEEEAALAAKRAKEVGLSEQDLAFEIQALESFKLDDPALVDPHRQFPPAVYSSYDELQKFARDLNLNVQLPEIVLMGAQGHGKSSVLEALLGSALGNVGFGGCTKRPIIFRLRNNPAYPDAPHIVLKRDSILPKFDRDVQVKPTQLAELLEARNVEADVPVVVQYEHAGTLDMILVDTPGLVKSTQKDDLRYQAIRKTVTDWIRPSHRTILAVEEAADLTELEMKNMVKRLDPEFARTVFVLSKFHEQLDKFTNTRAVNRYLQGTGPEATTFFVTLPNAQVRAKFGKTPADFQKKVWQYAQRDLQDLEALTYDKKYADTIGANRLRHHLQQQAWKQYQNLTPTILKALRKRKADAAAQLSVVQKELEDLSCSSFRQIATKYSVDFLQVIRKLLDGTSEGNPAVTGQTLEEEKKDHGDAEWYTASGAALKFEPGDEKWKVPYWNNRIYGGQQFERMLCEFKTVVEHTEFPALSMDQIATAAGYGRLNNVPDFGWAASDLAQQIARESLSPLIDQVTSRAVYIMGRLVDITQLILESRRRNSPEVVLGSGGLSEDSVANAAQYQYFTYYIKSLYTDFIERTAKEVQAKCMDEFHSTATIHWGLTAFNDKIRIPTGAEDEDTAHAVSTLSLAIFEGLRSRICKNVLLKFYNFFFVPIKTDLWNHIHTGVTTMDDKTLEQRFEIPATRTRLEARIAELSKIIESTTAQESQFRVAANGFCHSSSIDVDDIPSAAASS